MRFFYKRIQSNIGSLRLVTSFWILERKCVSKVCQKLPKRASCGPPLMLIPKHRSCRAAGEMGTMPFLKLALFPAQKLQQWTTGGLLLAYTTSSQHIPDVPLTVQAASLHLPFEGILQENLLIALSCDSCYNLLQSVLNFLGVLLYLSDRRH